MKKYTYQDIKDKRRNLQYSIDYLDKAIKSKKKKEIKKSLDIMFYKLHRLHKIALDKSTFESIQEINKAIWGTKLQKEGEKRAHVDVNKLYKKWSKFYDRGDNLIVDLEPKHAWKIIGSVKGKDVLDLGCGTGRYATTLAKKGARVTAIDFSGPMIKKAKEKSKKIKNKIKFEKSDIQNYKPKKKFDIIISMLVLDHIKDLKKVVNVIDKGSKIGTKVIISNIHPLVLYRNLDKKTNKSLGHFFPGVVSDQYYHSLEEYIDLFHKKGFVLTKEKEILVPEKYKKSKIFRHSAAFFADKPAGIIMRFEKIK